MALNQRKHKFTMLLPWTNEAIASRRGEKEKQITSKEDDKRDVSIQDGCKK